VTDAGEQWYTTSKGCRSYITGEELVGVSERLQLVPVAGGGRAPETVGGAGVVVDVFYVAL
jgi:hypothetical protein